MGNGYSIPENVTSERLKAILVGILPENEFKSVLEMRVHNILKPKNGCLHAQRLLNLVKVLRSLTHRNTGLQIQEHKCTWNGNSKLLWVAIKMKEKLFHISVSGLYSKVYIQMHIHNCSAEKTMEGLSRWIDVPEKEANGSSKHTKKSEETWKKLQRDCTEKLNGWFGEDFTETLFRLAIPEFVADKPFDATSTRKLQALGRFTEDVKYALKNCGSFFGMGPADLRELLEKKMAELAKDPLHDWSELFNVMSFIKQYCEICMVSSEQHLLEMAEIYDDTNPRPNFFQLVAIAVEKEVSLEGTGLPLTLEEIKELKTLSAVKELPKKVAKLLSKNHRKEQQTGTNRHIYAREGGPPDSRIDRTALLRWVSTRIIFKQLLLPRFSLLKAVCSRSKALEGAHEEEVLPHCQNIHFRECRIDEEGHEQCTKYCGGNDRRIKCHQRNLTEWDREIQKQIIPIFCRKYATMRNASTAAVHLFKHGGGENRTDLDCCRNLEQHCCEYFKHAHDLGEGYLSCANNEEKGNNFSTTYSFPADSQCMTAQLSYWDRKEDSKATMCYLTIQPDGYVYLKSLVVAKPTSSQRSHFKWTEPFK